MQILILSVALILVITNLNIRAQILRHPIMSLAASASSVSKVMFELFDSFRYTEVFVVRI